MDQTPEFPSEMHIPLSENKTHFISMAAFFRPLVTASIWRALTRVYDGTLAYSRESVKNRKEFDLEVQ